MRPRRLLASDDLLLTRIILQTKELESDIVEVIHAVDPTLANRLNHKVRHIAGLAEALRVRLLREQFGR